MYIQIAMQLPYALRLQIVKILRAISFSWWQKKHSCPQLKAWSMMGQNSKPVTNMPMTPWKFSKYVSIAAKVHARFEKSALSNKNADNMRKPQALLLSNIQKKIKSIHSYKSQHISLSEEC